MYSYRLDLLHLIDHHGVASHVVGNIFWAHVRAASAVVPGDNQEQRLAFLNDDVRAYYTARGVSNRLPKLKITNIRDDEFPELKGNSVKAANTRSLVPYALELQQRAVAIAPTEKNKHALKVVESLQALYDVFYSGGYFLTPAELATTRRQLLRLGLNYQRLAVLAVAENDLAWKQVPKLHYVVGHLAWQCRLINPRYVQTYGSEGMVGKICGIYRASQNGPYAAGLQTTILTKYRLAMLLTCAQ